MWIALYINCFRGKFVPVGPFQSEAGAAAYCRKQEEPLLWEPMQVKPQDQA